MPFDLQAVLGPVLARVAGSLLLLHLHQPDGVPELSDPHHHWHHHLSHHQVQVPLHHLMQLQSHHEESISTGARGCHWQVSLFSEFHSCEAFRDSVSFFFFFWSIALIRTFYVWLVTWRKWMIIKLWASLLFIYLSLGGSTLMLCGITWRIVYDTISSATR